MAAKTRSSASPAPAFDFEACITAARDSGFRRLSCDLVARWLYYRIGALDWFRDGDDTTGWTLADPQPYRGAEDRDRMRARIWTVARRLPFLPVEGKG